MHEVLVNRLGGLSLPRKSVIRLTDRPDMTLAVYRGRLTAAQQQQQIIFCATLRRNVVVVLYLLCASSCVCVCTFVHVAKYSHVASSSVSK